jgi:hypothetical protein
MPLENQNKCFDVLGETAMVLGLIIYGFLLVLAGASVALTVILVLLHVAFDATRALPASIAVRKSDATLGWRLVTVMFGGAGAAAALYAAGWLPVF